MRCLQSFFSLILRENNIECPTSFVSSICKHICSSKGKLRFRLRKKRERCNSSRFLCRAFVTKNQAYRNEFYRVMVTAVLIYTTLEHQHLNYRDFVKNFTGLSQSLIQGNRTILYRRNMSDNRGLS
jgi:hypothetical protein